MIVSASDNTFIRCIYNEKAGCRPLTDDGFYMICRTVYHCNTPVYKFIGRDIPCSTGCHAGAGKFFAKQIGLLHPVYHLTAIRQGTQGE